MKNKEISIDLTRDQALVLFELLRRIDEEEDSNIFKDQSEERVLWNIEIQLQDFLPEIFDKDYSKLILNAREVVRDKE
jgi:hypothetical protein